MIICPLCNEDLYYDSTSGIRFCEFCSNKLPLDLLASAKEEFVQIRQKLREAGVDIGEPKISPRGMCTKKFHRDRTAIIIEVQKDCPEYRPIFCYRCGELLPKV